MIGLEAQGREQAGAGGSLLLHQEGGLKVAASEIGMVLQPTWELCWAGGWLEGTGPECWGSW